MANMFALILVIATLVTGLLWCLDKFIFAPKRRERQAAAQAATKRTSIRSSTSDTKPTTEMKSGGAPLHLAVRCSPLAAR